jgi:hypothetical protein
MDTSLVITLEDLRRKLERSDIEDKNKQKYIKDLKNLVEQYRKVEVSDNHKATYDSLVKKGRELAKDANVKDKGKIEYYLRYCNAALYDFNENIKPLTRITLAYILTCMLFFVLSPQYFSFILPLILIIPIYMGLKGLKKRTLNGLMFSMSVIPIAILTSAAWLRNAFLASKNFDAFITSLATQYKMQAASARNTVLIFMVLSAVLLLSSIYSAVMGYKYRKMFI